ncbi:hypothetical protein [Nocardia sp. BMG51109]|nr:hypothetical protein [Nocardia sp. BMG51109]
MTSRTRSLQLGGRYLAASILIDPAHPDQATAPITAQFGSECDALT